MKQILADIIIQNGRVLTVNQSNEIAEAVAIRGNQILAVGSSSEMEEYLGPDTQVIDAEGKSVLPGFVDVHIHVGMFGLMDHGIINVAYRLCCGWHQLCRICERNCIRQHYCSQDD